MKHFFYCRKNFFTFPTSYFLSLFVLFFLLLMQSCNKVPVSSTLPSKTSSSDSSEYVIGAHGEMILKSNFHIIENGYKLTIQNDHIYKVEITSGKMIKDFGEYLPNANVQNYKRSTAMLTQSTIAGSRSFPLQNTTYGTSTSWVASEEWHNTNTNPINYFSTSCVVPPMPTIQQNQTYTFWIGLSPSTGGYNSIVQPILNYGQPPQSTATNSYQVFNYFFWINSSGVGNAAMTTPTTVTPGTNVKFIITYTGKTGSSYDYVSNIVNSSGASLTPIMDITIGNTYLNGISSGNTSIPTVSESNYADIVLEDRPLSPGMTSELEYPNTTPLQRYVLMNNITLSTGNPGIYNYPVTIPWYPLSNTGLAELGESAQKINTNNNNPTAPGQIELWYGPTPNLSISGNPNFNSSYTSTSGYITGIPLSTVTVTATVNNENGYYGLSCNLGSGYTFTNGYTSLSVSGSNVGGGRSASQTLILPASGSVPYTASLSQQNTGTTGTISVQ